MDKDDKSYPDDFPSTILLMEQLTSILHRDCAKVAEGSLASERFFETVSAAHEAVMRASELQERFTGEEDAAARRI